MSADADDQVPTDLTHDEARTLVDNVRQSLEQVRDDILRLWSGRGWIALGYASWDELCDAEFRVRLQLQDRQAVTRELSDSGMSNRGIASAVGVDEHTVRRDLRLTEHELRDLQDTLDLVAAEEAKDAWMYARSDPGAAIAAPGDTSRVTGKDGRSYPRTHPVGPQLTRPRVRSDQQTLEAAWDTVEPIQNAVQSLRGAAAQLRDSGLSRLSTNDRVELAQLMQGFRELVDDELFVLCDALQPQIAHRNEVTNVHYATQRADGERPA